jgi:hypothetical protein
MNRTALKNYAPQARRDFIQAITDRAAYYGLTVNTVDPVVQKGDVAVIAGREHPRAVAGTRKQLEERIKRDGFESTMEAVAYTWFNRLVAIRFMELHGYLDHGYRVLSHPEGKSTPEILEQAEHVTLAGLKRDLVIDLKLAVNKDGELYRLLLTAQCNALHAAMPFLFERIDDETELLLPDNLLHSDSLIRKLVSDTDEQDWQQVEIIGWLYQFYISEKKDEVIGKVVASEDIPSATQLFTPNWIVKYLVENTLGRQWLATYPKSPLRQKMNYYIEPAEQAIEVQNQLKMITPASLNPEELKLLDPACGSGHILVEAYDLFKAIYEERGYRAKDIPALILQKNLFGLEIDDRAAQLAAFALMMKARAEDRRIFDSDAKPNILAFQESRGMSASELTLALNAPINKDDVPSEYLFEEIQEDKDGLFSNSALVEKGHVSQADIASLLRLFENAKTFGSLLQVPSELLAKLPSIEKRLGEVSKRGNLTHASAQVVKPLLQQARLLSHRYDAVVANPPYMGGKYFSPDLKTFVAHNYRDAKADLYACFMQRNASLSKHNGFVGMITIPNWMFLLSFENVRNTLFATQTIDTFLHNGRGVFGSDFGSCCFCLRNLSIPNYRGIFRRLFEKAGAVATNDELAGRYFSANEFVTSNADFTKIPGSPVAYWASGTVRKVFSEFERLGDSADVRQGMATTDNNRFLRYWHEVTYERIGLGCKSAAEGNTRGCYWFPFAKGGDYRKWFGNNAFVVRYERNGEILIDLVKNKYPRISDPEFVIKNRKYYFRECVTWSEVTISDSSFRYTPPGSIFDVCSPSVFVDSHEKLLELIALLNSNTCKYLTPLLNPTVHFTLGDCKNLPYRHPADFSTAPAAECIALAKADWDSVETSIEFECHPMLTHHDGLIQRSYEAYQAHSEDAVRRMRELEEENNRLFIKAYGLEDELFPEVPDDQITLYRPESAEDIKRLLSFVVGCMMGRYSIDMAGLVYALGGNEGFDPSKYRTFRAEGDGIIPLLETEWGFRADATSRVVEFIGLVWAKERLEENLKFLAECLGLTSTQQPREIIRHYLATGFYKHHLSMYKRRPLYWLFSSGKQRAFQCLVYLHRYHEGTLARMRTEYVIPLQGQLAARIEQLEADKSKATSTSHRNKLQKDQTDLKKQQAELLIFEEKLKHLADQKITLDLDDGVKVNYAKFGDLLAESKAITGGKDEE